MSYHIQLAGSGNPVDDLKVIHCCYRSITNLMSPELDIETPTRVELTELMCILDLLHSQVIKNIEEAEMTQEVDHG